MLLALPRSRYSLAGMSSQPSHQGQKDAFISHPSRASFLEGQALRWAVGVQGVMRWYQRWVRGQVVLTKSSARHMLVFCCLV